MRLSASGFWVARRVVAIDDYIVTVKISNQKYDCRHEYCLLVGTEFSKLKANWAEMNEEEEENQPTIVMTRLASKRQAQITDQGGGVRSPLVAENDREAGATSLISRSSKKASRVAKSALAAEVMAASEACDEGHWVRHILE